MFRLLVGFHKLSRHTSRVLKLDNTSTTGRVGVGGREVNKQGQEFRWNVSAAVLTQVVRLGF